MITSDVPKTHEAYLTITQTGELPEISLDKNSLIVKEPNHQDESFGQTYLSPDIYINIRNPRVGAVLMVRESDAMQDGFQITNGYIGESGETDCKNYLFFSVSTSGKSYDFTLEYIKNRVILASETFTVKAASW